MFSFARGACVVLPALLLSVWGGSPSSAQVTSEARQRVDHVNQGVVGVMGASRTGTGTRIADEMAHVLNDDVGYSMRVLPIVGRGSVRNIEDLLYLRGIDITLVQSDVMDFFDSQPQNATPIDKVVYITKMYEEEFHILAADYIRSVDDLEGRTVNFGLAPTGSFMTASIIFDALGVAPDVGAEDHAIAIGKMQRGEIDAIAYTGGSPVDIIQDVPANSGFHLLEVPIERLGGTSYVQAQLTSDLYPNLSPPGTSLDTVATSAVMVAYDWPDDHPRHQRVANFVSALKSKLPELQGGEEFHQKWKTVDFTAEVPLWRRFD
jgi:TRAP transporter TAXI family solute receptor